MQNLIGLFQMGILLPWKNKLHLSKFANISKLAFIKAKGLIKIFKEKVIDYKN